LGIVFSLDCPFLQYLLDEYPVDEDQGERHNQQDVRKVENKLKLGNAAISCEVIKEALPKKFSKNLEIKAKFIFTSENI
jgi:hypothetical protein